MYYISVIDSANRKLRVASEHSQAKIDKITTSFKDSRELVKSLGLDPILFRVVIEKQKTAKDEPEEILFFDNRFSGIDAIQTDKTKQTEFFKKVSEFNRKELYEFFLNEYATRFEKVTKDYDDSRKEQLDKILDLFHDEEIYQEKYGEDKKKFTNNNLETYLRAYFIDQYGKFNYENAKYLYRYIVIREDNKNNSVSNNLTPEIINSLSKMKKILDKSLSIDKTVFDNEKLTIYKDRYEKMLEDMEDKPDFESEVYKNDDIDDIMTELGIYMDDDRMDEEMQHDYIEKNRKKLF